MAWSPGKLRRCRSAGDLQETLTATEDKIEFARRYYNTSARDYNIALQTFPRNLIAGPFGFKPVVYFATGENDRAVPQVSFSGRGPGAADPAFSGSPLASGPGGVPPAVGSQEPPPGS